MIEVRGELAYAVGELLGTSHCSLCDVTHAPVQRKPAWDAMTARLGVPFQLAHLDEIPDGGRSMRRDRHSNRRSTSTRRGRASYSHPTNGGVVNVFESELRRAIHRRGLRLPGSTA